MRWDPAGYLRFADERSRPFYDLVGRIETENPAAVVDLGCGPGVLTATLADRWPLASILGIDSSPEMIECALPLGSDRVRFERGDIAAWTPTARVDVCVCNAALQWVPEHRSVLPRLVDAISPGGYLAFQVPANFTEPSHVLLRELAAEPRFAADTAGLTWPDSFDAGTYLTDLAVQGLWVDAWETTYLHVLAGADAVFEWVSGTGARPVLQALPDDLRAEFAAEYRLRLRAAYPERPYGTVLPFRRVFVVARRAPA